MPIRAVPVEKIDPNPFQPETRLVITPETAEQFGKSILQHGFFQKPLLRAVNGRFQVADGYQRIFGGVKWILTTAPEAVRESFEYIECDVRDLTDEQMIAAILEANTVRRDLSDIELGKLYKRCLEELKITQSELARRHNCSQGEIANTIRLLELPQEIQGKIISHEISATHGRELLRLNYDAKIQTEVLEESVKQGYSVDRLSNRIAVAMFYKSKSLETQEYDDRPTFDTAACQTCEHRQKIGTPYADKRKTWRCLDVACYEKKSDQAEKDRVAKLTEEISAARKTEGKGKDKDNAGVLDLSKLTWRDYQNLDRGYAPIDNPGECKTCPRRALGKSEYVPVAKMVCVDVKCYKAKEQAHRDKAAAEAKEAEKKLTERVKAACKVMKTKDPAAPFRLIMEYLLGHCRKDTRERIARIFDLQESELSQLMSPLESKVPALNAILGIIIQLERYEGEKGRFKKMLGTMEGDTSEIDKAIAHFRAAHCKGCKNDTGNCRNVFREYESKRQPYCYYKKDKTAEAVMAE